MKEIETRFAVKSASYVSPKVRVLHLVTVNPILLNSRVDGSTIGDVTEEESEFFN